MYTFKTIDGMDYVIHEPSGCTLIYHSKIRTYDLASIPDYKLPLFKEWLAYTNNKRKVMKSKWNAEKEMKLPEVTWKVAEHLYNSLDCCDAPKTINVPQPCGGVNVYERRGAKEKKMYTDNTEYDVTQHNFEHTAEERKAEYLLSRLSSVCYVKDYELQNEFNLNVDARPKTPKEFVEFVKAGKLELHKNFLNDDGSWRDTHQLNFDPYVIYNWMTWVDPERKPDTDGYTKAYDKMTEAKVTAEDLITVGTPQEGLEALQNFKSATFH